VRVINNIPGCIGALSAYHFGFATPPGRRARGFLTGDQ